MENLTINVRYVWGGNQVLNVAADSVIGEELSAYGFCNYENSSVTYVYNGQILEPYLTFGTYKITSGSTIFVSRKKIRNQTKKFLEMLEMQDVLRNGSITVDFLSDNLDDENSRLADLSFAAWESMPECPKIIQDLYESQLDDDEMNEIEYLHIPMNTAPATSISEDPLPPLETERKTSSMFLSGCAFTFDLTYEDSCFDTEDQRI